MISEEHQQWLTCLEEIPQVSYKLGPKNVVVFVGDSSIRPAIEDLMSKAPFSNWTIRDIQATPEE